MKYELKEHTHVEMHEHGRTIEATFEPGVHDPGKDADKATALELLAAQGIAVPVRAAKSKGD